ncbi:Pheromone-binding protein Gp-9, partial [Trachymyrmex zeteki]
DDVLTIQDILQDKYKSENQEKLNKNGCLMQCMFQKDGMMEDAEYKVEKMHSEFIKKTNVQPGDKRFEGLDTCINEYDVLTIQDILQDKYKSENQEKLNKNGCLMQCMFQKDGMMEDAEYKVEKMHSEFIKKTNVQPGDKRFEGLDTCINESKDVTEKCEKAFLLTTCYFKSEREHLHDYGYDESTE